MRSNPIVYLDNNATTALDPEVLAAMTSYLSEPMGNASSRHALGRRARQAIDDAVESIARRLNARPEEIVFTSGATESNNLAILGSVRSPGTRIFVAATEHPSAMEPCLALGKRGYAVEVIAVDSRGVARNLPSTSTDEESLAVVQLANSETGTLQDIATTRGRWAARCRLHVDAVQGIGRVPVDFSELGASSLALSGHKIHGPPGIGALVARRDFPLEPLFFGGGQQNDRRPGTEPVALIVGLAKAVELAVDGWEQHSERMRELRDEFEDRVISSIEGVVRNGSRESRLPNTSNLSFLEADAQALLIALDLSGVMASSGTACASGSIEPSPVLRAMDVGEARLQSAVRFSVSRFTTREEIERAASIVRDCVVRVRSTVAPRGLKKE